MEQQPTRPGGPGLESKNKAGVPSFTADEAKTSAENLQFMFADPKSKKEVVSVLFMESKQASVLLLNASIGVPDDNLVCVIELKGLRVFASVPDAPKPVAQYRTTYLVLDALSGNILLERHVGHCDE